MSNVRIVTQLGIPKVLTNLSTNKVVTNDDCCCSCTYSPDCNPVGGRPFLGDLDPEDPESPVYAGAGGSGGEAWNNLGPEIPQPEDFECPGAITIAISEIIWAAHSPSSELFFASWLYWQFKATLNGFPEGASCECPGMLRVREREVTSTGVEIVPFFLVSETPFTMNFSGTLGEVQTINGFNPGQPASPSALNLRRQRFVFVEDVNPVNGFPRCAAHG